MVASAQMCVDFGIDAEVCCYAVCAVVSNGEHASCLDASVGLHAPQAHSRYKTMRHRWLGITSRFTRVPVVFSSSNAPDGRCCLGLQATLHVTFSSRSSTESKV
jgi:hypothetical protein